MVRLLFYQTTLTRDRSEPRQHQPRPHWPGPHRHTFLYRPRFVSLSRPIFHLTDMSLWIFTRHGSKRCWKLASAAVNLPQRFSHPKPAGDNGFKCFIMLEKSFEVGTSAILNLLYVLKDSLTNRSSAFGSLTSEKITAVNSPRCRGWFSTLAWKWLRWKTSAHETNQSTWRGWLRRIGQKSSSAHAGMQVFS